MMGGQPASSTAADDAGRPGPARPLWRNRTYMILWCGQLVSDLGSGISGFAVPLLILALTNSPALAGVAGTIGAIAYLIFALPAGALVDRWDRRRVMMVCDTGRALSLVSIPIAAAIGHLTVWQLYATSAIESSLYVFFSIAQVAALPRVVPREQLAAASVQNTGGNIATTILAPSVGGFLYQAVGRTVPFLADALSYAASALSLALIRVPFLEQRVARPRHLRAEIIEGVTWLWGQPLIRYMAFITSGLRGVGVGQALIIIVLARHQHASPAVIGLIFSIGSVGGVAGAFLAPSIQRRFTFGQVIIASLWVEALLWPCLALAPNPLLLGLVVAGLSIMGPSANAVQLGYRLTLIPDHLQGRVNSAFRLLAHACEPIGAVGAGLLLEMIGGLPTVLTFSAVVVALALVTTLNAGVRTAHVSVHADTTS